MGVGTKKAAKLKTLISCSKLTSFIGRCGRSLSGCAVMSAMSKMNWRTSGRIKRELASVYSSVSIDFAISYLREKCQCVTIVVINN